MESSKKQMRRRKRKGILRYRGREEKQEKMKRSTQSVEIMRQDGRGEGEEGLAKMLLQMGCRSPLRALNVQLTPPVLQSSVRLIASVSPKKRNRRKATTFSNRRVQNRSFCCKVCRTSPELQEKLKENRAEVNGQFLYG